MNSGDGKYIQRAKKRVQEADDLIYTIKILNYEGVVKERLDDFRKKIEKLQVKIIGLPQSDDQYELSVSADDFETELEVVENELKTMYVLEKDKKRICLGITNTEIYEIIPRCSPKMRVDIAGAAHYDGADAITFYANGQENQMFQIIECKKTGHVGCVLIRAVHSGKYIGRQNGKDYCGVNVCQTNSNPDCEENHWFIETIGKGVYVIICSHTDLALDISRGSEKAEANVLCWGRHEEINQQFILEPIDPVKSEAMRRKLLVLKPSTEPTPIVSSIKSWFK